MSLRKVLKYGIVGSAVLGTGLSLHANDYDLNSVGIVRLGRAGATVFDIAATYQANLYSREMDDKKSREYLQLKSDTHRAAAEKLLNLCRTNRGVYIKVGQHIGALEYLLPPEYVSTMKVLHSNAPQKPVEDLYRVIRKICALIRTNCLNRSIRNARNGLIGTGGIVQRCETDGR
uniref:Protein kinase domain-containing protein n=1 Tax=Anopheles funestus TaxID=62324 RepID=A0A4Y0BG66_ANOFN